MRKKHKLLILIITVLGLHLSANAQLSTSEFDQGYFSKKYHDYSYSNSYFSTLSYPLSNQASLSTGVTQNYGPYVPKVYTYKDLAFFCKLEVKMEKNAKLPIKVRLGDIDYVDWLEGKRDRY